MTSIATLFGAAPLVLATGPGSEARQVIGVAGLAGVIGATLITLVLVPGFYRLAARTAALPGGREQRLKEEAEAAEAAE
jgi:multidrug efflux pump